MLFVLLLSALQYTCAINVYLNPQLSSNSLSRHLGLDLYEPLRDASRSPSNEQRFVGTGSRNVLLLTLDEADATAVLPPSLQPAFKLHAASGTPVEYLSSMVSTFLHRAENTFTSIYHGAASPLELAAFYESAEAPSFAASEIINLSQLRQTYGSNSSEYLVAAHELREVIFHTYNNPDTFNLAILTASSSAPSFVKRDTQPQTNLLFFSPAQS
ncbi:hypothetical protein C0992_000097 [Termitomyces sp. T32_za158]|nr:hypothetical protein C0992_000097 [Termitomyces sp. T32_za158]